MSVSQLRQIESNKSATLERNPADISAICSRSSSVAKETMEVCDTVVKESTELILSSSSDISPTVPKTKLRTPSSAPTTRGLKKGRVSPSPSPSVRPLSGKPVISSIPLPVKTSPKSTPISRMSKSSIKSSKPTSRVHLVGQSKHTLEIQFLNKKRRLAQLKRDLVEKQKPVLDLYQSLVGIKKKLEELGKMVQLDELKLVPYHEEKGFEGSGAGESPKPEVVVGMKNSIEEIPKTLMGICKNLLSRRAVIVELLESVTKSEVDVTEMSGKIDSLKMEGMELQKSLDAIINEHEQKINDLVNNWQNLLSDKKSEVNTQKIEELQTKLQDQERLTFESHQVVQDLQRKLDDKKSHHDKSLLELDNVIRELKEKNKKLEQEIECEKKLSSDHKTRNSTNSQTIKSLKNKIAELEAKSKESEDKNTELSRKMKFLQDQSRNKESQWSKDKEEMTKNLKNQENLLQKLTTDRNEFETRYKEVEGVKNETETELQDCILGLRNDLSEARKLLETVTSEKEEITQRFNEMNEHMINMGMDNKQKMHLVTQSVDWGKQMPGTEPQVEIYTEVLANKILMRELEDKVRHYELERQQYLDMVTVSTNVKEIPDEDNKVLIMKHQECISKYQQLLQESEQKLIQKSMEVAKLNTEIRHLKVRQDALEEQNNGCPTVDLQKMVEEGRFKLNELMKKSMESEQKIANYECVVDKQNKQMNEMENLLRYRENMSGVMKASRDELLLEKESLTRYSQEMRTVLAEVTKEGKIKDRLIKELQEKLDLRERQINKLEKELRELEANLMMTNEKRFKLQETVGSMEKELQSAKAHVNQLADIQTRYDIGMQSPKSFISNYKVKNKRKLHENNVGKVNYPNNEINSQSLIGMSMKKIDFLRDRLQYLTKLSVINSESELKLATKDKLVNLPCKTCSTQTLNKNKDQKNFEKIVELTAKRYEILQKQAYESYEELCNLLKNSVLSKPQNICVTQMITAKNSIQYCVDASESLESQQS